MRRIDLNSHKIQLIPGQWCGSCASDLSGTVVGFLWGIGSYDSIKSNEAKKADDDKLATLTLRKNTKYEIIKSKNHKNIKISWEPVILSGSHYTST